MNESIPDALLKVADVLHFLGRYRESNVLVMVSRWLRARGIDDDDKLRYATEAAERDAFSSGAMGTAAEPEAIARLGTTPLCCCDRSVPGKRSLCSACPIHGTDNHHGQFGHESTETPEPK